MEWRKGSSCITKDNCTNVSYKCCRSGCLCKGNSMIAWVRLRNPWKFARCLPVKVTAVYDYSTDCSSMASDEFGCGMNDDICTILNRANQVRSCKCRINYKRNVMFVRNFATSSISIRLEFGFPRVSIKIAFVFSWIAASKEPSASGSTNVAVMPLVCGRVCARRLYVPP